MGAYKKDVIKLVNKCMTFLKGEPEDDKYAIKVSPLMDEPMFGIPAWNWSRGVKYQHIYCNVETGSKRLDYLTLVIAFRVNRHSYDQPMFFHVDRYGIRELSAFTDKKRLLREERNRKGEVLDTKEVINSEWAIRWEIEMEKFIHFECPNCKKHVEECECMECPLCFEKGRPLEGEHPWTCDTCGVDYDLYGYWKDGEYKQVADPEYQRKEKKEEEE